MKNHNINSLFLSLSIFFHSFSLSLYCSCSCFLALRGVGKGPLWTPGPSVPPLCRGLGGIEGGSQRSLQRSGAVRKTFSGGLAAIRRHSLCISVKLRAVRFKHTFTPYAHVLQTYTHVPKYTVQLQMYTNVQTYSIYTFTHILYMNL